MYVHDISQHWSSPIIALSWAIAVTGSFCTIQLMEQWRLCEHGPTKVALLGASAFALGGCGIWCMHFTGMNALGLHLDDGTVLEMHYSAFETVLSFIFPIVGVYIGLKISSTDPFFIEIEGARRNDILVKGFAKSTMTSVMSRKTLARRIKLTALFSRLWRILLGGVFAALGVLSMHYMGMRALRTNASIDFHMNAVIISAVIAVFAATTAFWIIFRAHTFWPESMLLRVCSALIMGCAVCGTHYSGMTAAQYTHTDEDYSLKTKFILHGTITSNVASHLAVLICYWITSLGVTTGTVQMIGTQSRSGDDRTGGPTGASQSRRELSSRLFFTRGLTIQGSIVRKIYAAQGENTPAVGEAVPNHVQEEEEGDQE